MTALPGIGSVIADRFVIEALAGSGGMGTVFRARDRRTGDTVALKVCHPGAPLHAARFSREIRALAALRHPGIVAYVDHGHTADWQPFLAMEWLEGEDLAHRLRHQPLRPAESLILARRIADALSAAHQEGIVHRDVKPSNVFLPGGRVEEARLLDFGIARLSAGARGTMQTASGALVGTPDYMAPEQARGDVDVGPAADLFSLGALLFECLTGRPPFAAERVMAVLAKIAFEEAPRLSSAWPGAPPALDDLVARLLAKDPAQRPASAAAVLAELAAVQPLAPESAPTLAELPALHGSEQQIVCVVLAVLPPASPARPSEARDPSPASSASRPDSRDAHLEALEPALSRYECRIETLADGSIALAFGQTARAAATDRAAQAARCALLLKERWPAARVAIATGRWVLQGRTPGGSAVDRAADLLDDGAPGRLTAPSAPNPVDATPQAAREDVDPPIWIDDVTAGLIATSFAIHAADGGRHALVAERINFDPSRPLLGKPTPCVGRELELSALTAALASVVEEPCARAVVVRAPPGMGKSRLRHELMRRAGVHHPDLIVLMGRGDPMGAGSAYGMLGQALRDLFGMMDGTPLDEQRRRILGCAGERAPAAAAPRIAAFLGELCGVHFPDEHLIELRSARQDAGLMAEQITQAFLALLRAECAERPLLLVLEDLHWGDRTTVRLVGAALRELADLPLLVLALARPDIDELFPRLWEEHGPTNIVLRALGRRACERLARGVLGPDVPDAVIDRIVQQSGGNALFLEELIRAVADGKGDALPESVLAMLQARLMRLAPDARRVLRAASVLGGTFWTGGVAALCGGARPAAGLALDERLDDLVERELIERRAESRFPGQNEYAFRHAIVRDVAYAMLTEPDRALGHRLAGAWLEQAGEREAIALAKHFELGGERARAAIHHARAAEQALEAHDFDAMLARAEAGIACGAEGETLGLLQLFRGDACFWLARSAKSEECTLVAMALLPKGSPRWFQAVYSAFQAIAFSHGDIARLAELAEAMLTPAVGPVALASQLAALAQAVRWLVRGGMLDLAGCFFDRLDAASASVESDPLSLGYLQAAFALRSQVAGEPAQAHAWLRTSIENLERAGYVRYALPRRMSAAMALTELGAYARAEAELRGVVADAGEHLWPGVMKYRLAEVLARRGELDEARALLVPSVAEIVARKSVWYESGARRLLAMLLLHTGDPEQAEVEARQSVELCVGAPLLRPAALSTLAHVELRRGRVPEARENAQAAIDLLRRFQGVEEGEAFVRLVYAEARFAHDGPDAGREAVSEASARLRARAAKIDDPAWRKSFLEDVWENARTLQLETQWSAG